VSILVLAEHDNKTLKKATLNALAAAQKSAAISMCWLRAVEQRMLRRRRRRLRE